MFFFFNDTATTEIYTLSLHDALPILSRRGADWSRHRRSDPKRLRTGRLTDRKSTRLNSSHLVISYAVFCLKKKTNHREESMRAALTSTSSHYPLSVNPCPSKRDTHLV